MTSCFSDYMYRCFVLHLDKQSYVFLTFASSCYHHTIQINQSTRCSSFTILLLDIYVWLNMFRAPLRPSSGAYNCTRSLWFYRWSVVVGALLVVVCQKRYHLHVKNLLRTLVFSHPNTPLAILSCTMQNNLLYSDGVHPTHTVTLMC